MSSSDNPQFETQPEPRAVVTNTEQRSLEPGGIGNAPLIASPPPRDPVWSGWDVLLMAAVAIASFIVITTVLAIGLHMFFPRISLNSGGAKIAVGIQALTYLALAVFMVMLVRGKYQMPFWQAIHWNWPSTNARMAALGAVGIFTIMLDVLGSRLLPMPKSTPFDQLFSKPSDAYLIVILAVTLGPLMEELFFRGFLYPVLARRTGIALGVLLTSIPFGLMHYFQYKSWAAVLVLIMVSVVLTLVRVLTRSVASSFVVHASYNGALMVLAGVATDGFRHMDKLALLRF